MKSFVNMTMFMLIFLNVSISQSSIANADNYFVQTRVGENLTSITAKEGNLQVSFHKDKIELVSTVDGNEELFSIQLKNVEFDTPEGEGLVCKKTLSNKTATCNMSAAQITEKLYFKSIKYLDAKTGKSVVISMKGNKIDFDGLGQIPLELQLSDNKGLSISTDQKMQFEELGKIIELSSKNSLLEKEKDIISFKQGGGNDNASLHLTITII